MAKSYTWKLQVINERTVSGSIDSLPEGAVLCFSMMVPVKSVSSCEVSRNVGGYTELSFGPRHGSNIFSFEFAEAEFKIYNLSWLPQGAYIREAGGACADVEMDYLSAIKQTTANEGFEAETGLRLVPKPTIWEPIGTVCDMRSGFDVDKSSPFLEAIIAADALADRNGLTRLIGTQSGIPLRISKNFEGPKEGYDLTISEQEIRVLANSRTGVFYAAMSLLNLAVNYDGVIPCGKITDAPRFEWRGQQLDCARHFYQPETLMRMLDLLALMKLNRFHWHFSDDESFRLEVECYPEIWQETRLRGEGLLVPGVFGGGKGPTGGSYSLEFTRALIKRASDLEIEVLPEIEIPAHAYALLRVFPELYDENDASKEDSVQGYIGNTMNPAQPFMWVFLENLIKEITCIFPSARIHLGCDEQPPKAWGESPAAQKLMARESLETQDDLLGWTIEKAGKIVRAHGCQPCAWEEAAKGSNGGIGNDAILFSWTGKGPGIDAARNGYKVVMTPAQHLYFDMAKSDSFDSRGAIWAGTHPLEDTVDWLPVPADEPELEDNIIGVEGAFWSEFTNKDEDMEWMIAPRILGLAEIAWRPKGDPADAVSINISAVTYQRFFDRINWATE